MTQTFLAPVIENTSLGGDTYLLRVTVSHGVATQVRPGHYFFVRASDVGSLDPLLRRPLSYVHVDPLANEVSFLVHRVGRGTDWITRRREGEMLDLFGPLGTPFTVGGTQRHLLVVAEGVRIAPLVPLMAEAVAVGAEVVLLAGAATASAHLPLPYLPEAVEVNRATDDGTLGAVGSVAALMPPYLDWADAVYAAGEPELYTALRGQLRAHRGVRTPPVQVHVATPLPCGIGVCRGCIVETRRGPELACVDGPVFSLTDLVG